ncbi:hypothetical protein HYV81_01385 [Candidatus Woesearchaeota archaeon]|nr:hypothetical protein [Candidatus Woesearchaeota archaeon]
MATEDEIYNMAVSLGKTGVAANMTESLALARSLLSHQEEKAKLKEELKQKELQERLSRPFILPPVRLGVEGEIDLSKPLNELLAEPVERPQVPAPQPNAKVASEKTQQTQDNSAQNNSQEAPNLFNAFKTK